MNIDSHMVVITDAYIIEGKETWLVVEFSTGEELRENAKYFVDEDHIYLHITEYCGDVLDDFDDGFDLVSSAWDEYVNYADYADYITEV